MRYVGLSIKEILRLRIVTMKRVAQYYLRNLLPNRALLKSTLSLRGSKKGKCAFVFANGPSMKILDPGKVKTYSSKGYDVFAVNSYINTEFAKLVPPNYFVLSDPAHFGINMHLLSGTRQIEVQEDIDKIRSIGVTLFVPVEFYSCISNIKTYPFCDSENVFSENTIDILRPRGYVSMTAYKALSIACYLGYDKIFICGFDNNYFKTIIVDDNNERYYLDDHFYSQDNAFHRVRIDEGADIGEQLYDLHFLFKGLNKFARVPIVNLDKSGLVDCFSKHHGLDVYYDTTT